MSLAETAAIEVAETVVPGSGDRAGLTVAW